MKKLIYRGLYSFKADGKEINDGPNRTTAATKRKSNKLEVGGNEEGWWKRRSLRVKLILNSKRLSKNNEILSYFITDRDFSSIL